MTGRTETHSVEITSWSAKSTKQFIPCRYLRWERFIFQCKHMKWNFSINTPPNNYYVGVHGGYIGAWPIWMDGCIWEVKLYLCRSRTLAICFTVKPTAVQYRLAPRCVSLFSFPLVPLVHEHRIWFSFRLLLKFVSTFDCSFCCCDHFYVFFILYMLLLYLVILLLTKLPFVYLIQIKL